MIQIQIQKINIELFGFYSRYDIFVHLTDSCHEKIFERDVALAECPET